MNLLELSPSERAAQVKAWGREIGFDEVGIAPPGPHPEMGRLGEWLERGYHGTMAYMARHRRRREQPNRALPNIAAVIVASLGYDTEVPRSTAAPREPGKGWISRYAWGADYHEIIEPLLDRWVAHLSSAAPGHRFLRYVDHGPVMEKVFGHHAGLGWIGKHTNLIHPRRGSFFFLATILSDLPLAPDSPVTDHCGSCTACLDACPTQAFPAPWVLDARRCISYLTIETKAPIPPGLDASLGDHLFGCDICQDVCPWNRKPLPLDRVEFQPRDGMLLPDLAEWAVITDAEFATRTLGSPVARAGAERIRARARAALDNQ